MTTGGCAGCIGCVSAKARISYDGHLTAEKTDAALEMPCMQAPRAADARGCTPRTRDKMQGAGKFTLITTAACHQAAG
jgi:hypothetical protein